MNHVRTVAPMLLTVLLACGGDDSKQAKAPQTTGGETTSSSTTMGGMGQGTQSGMTGSGMTGSGTAGSGMAGSDTSTGSGSMGTTGTTGSTGSGSTGSTGSSGMGTGGASTTTFNDAEIAAIVASVNTGEVEEGKAAQKKAKDPKVKAFAAKMVNHHTSANTKQADLLKKLKMTTSENATSRELASEGANTLQSLNAQSGAEFDRAYIDAQVREHQKVLTMLDNQLIVQAQSSELKQMLQTLRNTIDSHLREATDLQKNLTKTK